MRVTAVRILLSVLALLALAGGAAADGPWKITPGTGVGPILLGMDVAEVDKILTVKDRISDGAGLKWVRYEQNLEVHVERGKVLQILVNASSGAIGGLTVPFVADAGLQVGAGVPQMESAYGRDYIARDLKTAKSQPRETYYAYTHKGVGFIARNNRLIQIAVWARK